jgi:hypothetical protein
MGEWKYSFSIIHNIKVSGQLHALAASIIIKIKIIGKRAVFEPEPSLEDSARFVYSVAN